MRWLSWIFKNFYPIVDQNGSDLHLGTNVAPAMRLNGNICPVDDGANIIAPEDAQRFSK